MKVELIEEGTTKNPVMAIAKAASECYDSKPSKEVVKHVLDSDHASVAEHAKYQFRVSGTSRALSHQLVRKRIGASYSQRSQRYVNEEKFNYVTPESIKKSKWSHNYHKEMDRLSRLYTEMVADGISKEDARFVFPNAIFTSLHLSMNQRSLMDFCKVRMCNRSQWEIRELAYKLKEKVNEVSPLLASYLKPKCEVLGYCNEGNQCCGKMPTKTDALR